MSLTRGGRWGEVVTGVVGRGAGTAGGFGWGRPIRLTANRLRTLLAALAMSAGKTVSMERLTEMVWSDGCPANSRRSLQNYAARLRSALGGGWVETRPNGFLLRVDADDVDALRFGRILDRAARAQDSDLERGLLDEALALSRGEPFEDVASPWLQEAEAPRLAERYLAALERYEELRIRLAEDLGVDPNAELQQLYAELLVDPPATALLAPRLRVIPRTIPAASGEVVGRSAELAALSDLARSGSAAVALVTGPAGTGKTAMAVHWAHSIADRFADGQLYLDLRGSHDAPVEPVTALRTLLRALGVPPKTFPPTWPRWPVRTGP
ncbi:AAA family ATPase [Nonomuraea sp. NPDC049709]|uniref:AAA family ATPase n=1 Tax=Nonomuraea sp. NPDC049709 TaxID=3154736 RepID=UPI003413F658